MAYEMKTTPYAHQLRDYLATRDLPAWGLLYEQGCGKSKPVIDTGGHLFSEGKITGMVIVSLREVVRNWARQDDLEPGELQKHLNVPYYPHFFVNRGTKGEEAELLYLLKPDPFQLKILMLSVGALSREASTGSKLLKVFLKKHQSLLVVDESSLMQDMSSRRCRQLLSSQICGRAPYRRILEGTPIGQSPMGLFPQIAFLDPKVFGSSIVSFRSQYAETEKDYVGGGRVIEKVTGFKNLEHMTARLKTISSRVLKADCLDLPPKVYDQLEYEPTAEHCRVYNEMAEQMLATLDSGDQVTVDSIMAKTMKLRQLASGFILSDGQVHVVTMDRVNLLVSRVIKLPGKVIIWTSFKWSNLTVAQAIRAEVGETAVLRIDGSSTPAQRAEVVTAFQQDTSVRFLVANDIVMQRGVTLVSGSYNEFFDHNWSAMLRQQCEDRTHRIGQVRSVTYNDVLSSNMIDRHVRKVNREAITLANLVVGEGWRGLFEPARPSA